MKKTLFTLVAAFMLVSSQANAGFSGYPGYTSGALGHKIGCAILSWLRIPGCGNIDYDETED